MIARRDFFIKEITDRLAKKYPERDADIEVVIGEFIRDGWLADEKFTAEFIRVKSEYSGWGPRKISQKLKEKGVSSDIISIQMQEVFSADEELSLVSRLAQEKWNLLHKKKAPERTAAVQRFLASRGFNFILILDATKNLSSSSLGLPEDQ